MTNNDPNEHLHVTVVLLQVLEDFLNLAVLAVTAWHSFFFVSGPLNR